MFGIDRYPLVDLVDKDDPVLLEAKLAELSAGLQRVLSVEVTGGDFAPDPFVRAASLYALSSGHASAEVALATGASGAAVGRVRLAGVGQTPAAIFLKTTQHMKAKEEFGRYRQHVSNRLAPGFFAHARTGVRGLRAILCPWFPRLPRETSRCSISSSMRQRKGRTWSTDSKRACGRGPHHLGDEW